MHIPKVVGFVIGTTSGPPTESNFQSPASKAQDLYFCISEINTVRSDVEERVAEERLAWNDKNVPAWNKNISVLRTLGPLKSVV